MRFRNILYLLFLAVYSVSLAAPQFPNHWDNRVSGPDRSFLNCGHAWSLDDDSLHVYNAVHFAPNLNFDFVSHEISGYVLIQLTTDEQPLDHVDLRLSSSLVVDSVWTDSGFVATQSTDGIDSVQVHLNPPLAQGDTVEIGIAYHGVPASIDTWGGFRWGSTTSWQPAIGFSMGDGLSLDPPPANYNWIPTYADPTDKATWECWLTVPAGKTVSSNGIRIDTLAHGDSTTTWHYRLDHPISTYLFFVSASDYVIQTQRPSGPLIENFVYPSRVSQAEVHFANVPTVLDSFVAWFGPFPFERMGYNMTRIGDMEHATCVSHLDAVVNANHTYDWLLFHEMSHMWWGDWVTCGDWKDLWLNEGFGTYCEALGMEALSGHSAYMNYVVTNLYPDGRLANDSYSIYDPDYYWGRTVYQKGACVMHMLRSLLGDTAFFAALREYGDEHAYAGALTTDWQAKLEEHYGGSLDWFFQPWVYGTRFPRYRVASGLDGTQYYVGIRQVQTTPTFFTMPVDVRVFNDQGDSLEWTVWNEASADPQYYYAPDPDFVIDSVWIDPGEKILKTAVYVHEDLGRMADEFSPPSDFRVVSLYPNPFNPVTRITLYLPSAAPLTIKVYDLTGRQVRRYDLGTWSSGTHSWDFDASGLPSGLYLFRAESRFGSQTAKALLLK